MLLSHLLECFHLWSWPGSYQASPLDKGLVSAKWFGSEEDMGWFLCIEPKETEGVFSSCCLCWWGEMNGWLEDEWWELLCMTSRCIQVRDEPPKRSHLDDDYLQSIVLPLSVKKYWLLKFSSWRKETMQSDERGRKHKVLFVWLNKDPFFDESTPTWNRFRKKWAGFFFFSWCPTETLSWSFSCLEWGLFLI